MINEIKINRFECGLLEYFTIYDGIKYIKTNLEYALRLSNKLNGIILIKNNTIVLTKHNTDIYKVLISLNLKPKTTFELNDQDIKIILNDNDEMYKCFFLMDIYKYDELESLNELLSNDSIILTTLKKDIIL